MASDFGNILSVPKWRQAVGGCGAWTWHCNQRSACLMKIVRNFSDLEASSPEGLTLAEEFALIWQDDASGELSEYSFFGKDEAFHHAIYGAALLGLRARGLLEFEKEKCRYLGTTFKLVLSGEAPEDSEVLKSVYKELQTQPTWTLKTWFEEKTGKWGQDSTTQLVLEALVHRGILEKGSDGDAFKRTTYRTKDLAVEAHIDKRLKDVIEGTCEADGRSVALLSLMRSVDQSPDVANNQLLQSILGEGNVQKHLAKINELVADHMHFGGINAEAINSMLDRLPTDMQNHLCSDAFWNPALETFKKLDANKDGSLDGNEIDEAVRLCLPPGLAAALGVKGANTRIVLEMFDSTRSGTVEEEEFVGFLMWAHAMKAAVADAALQKDGTSTEEQLHKLFEEWDTDGSGTISRQELGSLLKFLDPTLPEDSIKVLFRAADLDKDGTINYKEFVSFLYSGQGPLA